VSLHVSVSYTQSCCLYCPWKVFVGVCNCILNINTIFKVNRHWCVHPWPNMRCHSLYFICSDCHGITVHYNRPVYLFSRTIVTQFSTNGSAVVISVQGFDEAVRYLIVQHENNRTSTSKSITTVNLREANVWITSWPWDHFSSSFHSMLSRECLISSTLHLSQLWARMLRAFGSAAIEWSCKVNGATISV